jgi:hypothetical protein
MKYSQVQSALDAHLLAVADLPELQLENTRNVGRTGVPFVRSYLRTSESTRAGLLTQLNGRYVIDLFYPMDASKDDANAMADAICAHFRNATLHRLEGDGVVVQLEKEWSETLGRKEPFYMLQVFVKWHAQV